MRVDQTWQTKYWLQTYSGKRAYPLEPDPSWIDITDIAHALSLICRFTGHVREFYSVAQHSVMASFIEPEDHPLEKLLHDASEYLMTDVNRPIKHSGIMEQYLEAEDRLMEVIAEKFGLEWPLPPCVKEVDNIMLITEKRDLLDVQNDENNVRWIKGVSPLEQHIVPWSPQMAEQNFLMRFRQLSAPHIEA